MISLALFGGVGTFSVILPAFFPFLDRFFQLSKIKSLQSHIYQNIFALSVLIIVPIGMICGWLLFQDFIRVLFGNFLESAFQYIHSSITTENFVRTTLM